MCNESSKFIDSDYSVAPCAIGVVIPRGNDFITLIIIR